MTTNTASNRVMTFFESLERLVGSRDDLTSELGKMMVAFSFMTLIFRLKEITYRPGTQIPENFIKGLAWGNEHASFGFWLILGFSLTSLGAWVIWLVRKESNLLLPALAVTFLLTWSYPLNLMWALGGLFAPPTVELIPSLVLVSGSSFKLTIAAAAFSLFASLFRRIPSDALISTAWLASLLLFRYVPTHGNDMGLVLISACTLIRLKYLFWTGLVLAPVAIPQLTQVALLGLLIQPGIRALFFRHSKCHTHTR